MQKLALFAILTGLWALPVMAESNPTVQVYFSPGGGATEGIVQLISEAQHTIRLAAYSFTSRPIAKALIEAHKRGVDVQAVLDQSNNSDQYTSASFLANEGIPTRTDSRYNIMHNKFLIVDGVTVETGSFNYTKAAESRNAENVLILRNYPQLAEQYGTRWRQLWEESEDYKARY